MQDSSTQKPKTPFQKAITGATFFFLLLTIGFNLYNIVLTQQLIETLR